MNRVASIPSKSRFGLGLLLVTLLAGANVGCGASASQGGRYGAAPPPPPASPAYAKSGGSYDAAPSPQADGPYPSGRSKDSGPRNESPPAATAAPPQEHADKAAEVPGDRPGLATHFGEQRSSFIHSTTFTRADFDSPSATATLWYNDRAGSKASASYEGYRQYEHAAIEMASSGITVSLKDGNGRALPGYYAGGKTFAIGEGGSRYTIVLSNHTPARFEAVVSVDGLDVLDGRAASFEKRGYMLNPHETMEIEGFRTSESEVATFRFGSVRGSYADRKGDDRNVGVIGVALFHERGVAMWPWPQPNEVERRRNADPFPGRFASPP